MIDMNTYQQSARKFAVYPEHYEIVYPTLGLSGEAGEVAEKIKKLLRQNVIMPMGIDSYTREEIAKELGDVLWYLANLATDLGYDLSDIAEMNLFKLTDRQHRNVIHGEGDNR